MTSANRSSGCQAGDLAIIVQSRTHPESIGRFVEILQRAPAGSFSFAGGEWDVDEDYRYWIIKSMDREPFIEDGESCGPFGVFAEHCLKPIRGIPKAAVKKRGGTTTLGGRRDLAAFHSESAVEEVRHD